VVYISGFDDTDDSSTFAIASCDSESRMPAVGIVDEDIINGDTASIRISSLTSGFNTSGQTVNDPVYVGLNGSLSYQNPYDINSNYITQQMGVIVSVEESPNGLILLYPLEIHKTIPHAETHYTSGNDTINHSLLANLGIDSHTQYVLDGGGNQNKLAIWSNERQISHTQDLTWDPSRSVLTVSGAASLPDIPDPGASYDVSAHGILYIDASDHKLYYKYYGSPALDLTAAAGGGVDHGALTGLGDNDHPHYLLVADIDDTPINNELTQPISSNWAYDHGIEADPHSVYRLESADHTHQSTGAQAGKLDHGLALSGLGDNDHPQYSLATTENQRWTDSSSQRQDLRDAADGYVISGGGWPLTIPVWETENKITYSAQLWWDDSTGIFRVGNGTLGNTIVINGAAEARRRIAILTGGVNRWRMGVSDITPETGSDVGSNFSIVRFDDAGGFLGVPVSIVRRTGDVTIDSTLNVDGYVSAETLISDVAIGTAPLTVTSTTLVSNLNVESLNSQAGSYYLDSGNFTGTNWTDLTDSGGTTLHTHALDNLSDVDGTDTPDKNDHLVWDGSQWTYSPDGTTFTFSIATFTDTGGSAVVEIGTGTWKAIGAVSFSATYNNGPATDGVVNLGEWGGDLTLTGGSFEGPTVNTEAITYPAVDGTRVLQLQATDGSDPDTNNNTYYFRNNRYWGVTTTASGYSEADIEGLAGNDLSNTRVKTFTVIPGAGEYIVYSYPSRLGSATFTVGGFEGGFESPETVSVTNTSSYTEDYYIYRSTNSNLGSTEVVVT